MTVAAIGHGVRVQRNPGNSPAEVEDIGELLEVSGPSLARDAVEATHSRSANRFREFISGLRDGGEITLTIALYPDSAAGSSHRKLVDDYEDDDAITYRMLFPDGATYWEFDGLVTSLEHASPIDDRMTMAVTIKISGQPELGSL